MFNTKKQIEYWRDGALDDLTTAKILIQSRRFLHGLFFCHLVIEKALKANVVNISNDFAPRSHNLFYLSEMANLEIDDDVQVFMGILMKFQLQGRYPDYNPAIPDNEKLNEYLFKTEELLQWLLKKL
ncbi:MAG: HEPN domain-containing protein [Paludibacter sp.]|jgi:HEPN domain-containing protein|nr:HEPN domain-containing protein [Paludibacter sp.]